MALTLQSLSEEERKRREAEFKENMNSNTLPGVNNPIIDLKKRLPIITQDENTIRQTGSLSEQKKLSLYEPPAKMVTPAPTSNYISNNSTGDVFTLNADNSISGTQPLKEIGRMGGYKPDGTSIVPSGNQGDVDALKNPSPQSLRNLQQAQFAEREFIKNYRPPVNNNGITPGMNESERIAIRNENTARANALLTANTSIANNRTNALNEEERNRLEGINVAGQNRLRDIQGQVAQAPPIKQLDDTYGTIDTFDDLGNKTGQKIYNKATGQVTEANQTTFAIPKPATTAKLLKMKASKDPNFAAAEAEYKTRFGSLPY